jgi:hypothetical protein
MLESRFCPATYEVTGEVLKASLATINGTARQLIEAVRAAALTSKKPERLGLKERNSLM